MTTYIYDANDRLLEETGPDGVTIYTYDENGNTTSKVAPDGTVDYHYNADDRLTRATGALESTASEVSYTYDAHGIRQRQVVDGVVARFLVDPTHQYAQVLEELDGAGNAVALYVIGLERIRQTRAGRVHTYHADGLGSIRALTDETGTRTDRYVYEAYGLLEYSEGNTDNPFRYTGEQDDPTLGFYYLRARYYNPATGRFPTMDTYQGRIHEPQTLHKYLYVHADPVNNIDPSGLMTLTGLVELSMSTQLRASMTVAGRATLRRAYRRVHEMVPRPYFLMKTKRGFERHHIIEKRFMNNVRALKITFVRHQNLWAVYLRPRLHQRITNAWARALRKKRPNKPRPTYTLDQLQEAGASVYRLFPHLRGYTDRQIALARVNE
ncbi:MAG: hypothetical protein LAT56_13135 [Wenzhouxiangella sp.]|nr:hypothetical protein [Wenzhouxiangella sp.]